MASSFAGSHALNLPEPERTLQSRGPARTAAVSTANRRLAGLLPGCLCLAGLAACTWLSFSLGQGFAFTGFLYVVLVVLAALFGGLWQATLISVAAAACLDYFFIPPIFSFANSPANWVALGAFEFTALVISRLSLRAQSLADQAISERRDMERLYEISRRILLSGRSNDPGNLIASLIREVFDCKAVLLLDADSAAIYHSGEDQPAVKQRIRQAVAANVDVFDPTTSTWYCIIRLDQRSLPSRDEFRRPPAPRSTPGAFCATVASRLRSLRYPSQPPADAHGSATPTLGSSADCGDRAPGGLALTGTAMNQLAATALASLCGIALERARALERESRAEAARQTEQLRTSVLDALAHQFKTPLTIVRTASSGLLALGSLSELQADLLSAIDQQATVMDRLASRLLGAAKLDSTEFRPKQESLLLSGLVPVALGELKPEGVRERFHLSLAGGEIPVFADRSLVLTALAQLFDNAIKYSQPGSPIQLTIEVRRAMVVLTVRTTGPVITTADCQRIFERFYRGPQAHSLPSGTGLGLSIVKKTVEAHQGDAWAEGKEDGTAFSIALPAASPRDSRP